MSPNENDLRATLREDAERIDAGGDFATAAISRERRRVRRRVIAGAAAAALVAAATPLLWSSGQPDVSPVPANPTSTAPLASAPTSSRPTAPGTTTPSPSWSTAAPSTRPRGTPTYDSNVGASPAVSVEFDGPRGTPRTGYAVGGVLHDGDRTVPLPVSTGVQYVARLVDGSVLVYAPTEGRAEPLIIVNGSGAVVARFADVQDVAVSDSGSRIATADASGTLRLRDVTGRSLASFATADPNVTVSGIVGDSVYYLRSGSKGWATRVWHSTTGKDAPLVSGRIRAIHEASSLAIVWPNQDFDPQHTCYSILDLKRGTTRYVSCGEFAPTHFTGDGSMVVGPNVADGPGASSWKVASAENGKILLRVVAPKGNWAPGPRGVGTDGLVVTLLEGEPVKRQVIASCTVSSRSCTVDSDSVAVSAKDADSMRWPITLSAN